MLQDIIAHAQMPPKALYDRIVQTKDFNKKLSPEEWQIVNKLANPDKGFKVLDVSLAYRIVKHFRNAFVTKPTRNWGSNPTSTEVEIGDDVERIRRARNRYLHGLSINITEKIMSDFFTEFAEVAKRIDQYLNKTLEFSFEKKIENLRTCSIDEKKTRETLEATSVVENQEGTTFLVHQQNKKVTVYRKKGLTEYIRQQISLADDADKSPFVLIFPEIQDEDAEEKAKLLNDFKDEINKGQLKFVFDRATEGSLLLYVEVTKSLLEQESSFLIEISTFMDRISELIDFGPDETIHVIITQPNDELCDIETDSDTENDMSEEEEHIDQHELAVYFRLKKETLASEETFQEGMNEFIETIVTIANGKHLTEKQKIDAIVAPGIESETFTEPIHDLNLSQSTYDVDPILDFNESITKQWRKKLDKFVLTKATTVILEAVKRNKSVILTGNPGCGKSSIAYYIAFYLEKNEGYHVVSLKDPADIPKKQVVHSKQLYLFDDVVGHYRVQEQYILSWDREESAFNAMLLHNSNVKVIMTCRSNIYDEGIFVGMELYLNNFNLHSKELSPTVQEKIQILQSYLQCPAVNVLLDTEMPYHHSFPLLCSIYRMDLGTDFFQTPVKLFEQILNTMRSQKGCEFLFLALLSIFETDIKNTNLNLYEHILTDLSRDLNLSPTCKGVELLRCSSQMELFIIKTVDGVRIRHTFLRDIVCHYIGKVCTRSILNHSTSSFISERIVFQSIGNYGTGYNIKIKSEFEDIYFQRLVKDISKGFNWQVLGNVQTKHPAYRKRFIEYLNSLDASEIQFSFCSDGTSALHVAAYLGYLEFCEFILKVDPVQLFQVDKGALTPLHLASIRGHSEVIQLFAEHKADLNIQGIHKRTSLHFSCLNGHYECANVLLNFNASMKLVDKFTNTPLLSSCMKNNIDIISLLLQRGASANTVDGNGVAPMHIACQNGQIRTIYLLLNHKADIHQTLLNGKTSFHIASEYGKVEVVNILLKSGAKINKTDMKGNTSLHLAVLEGHESIAELLLTSGASLRMENNEGNTPLHTACFKNNLNLADLLISHGANVNTQNKKGVTPLIISCGKNFVELTQLLIQKCADVNKAMENGFTPLHLACKSKCNDIVEFLLRNDANLNQTDNNKLTALHIACDVGHYKSADILLQKGSTVNLKTRDGITPLHFACYRGHRNIAELLLKHNAKINVSMASGLTALDIACSFERLDICGILLKNNAAVNEGDMTTFTPLYVSCKKGYLDIVELLINNNADLNCGIKTKFTPFFPIFHNKDKTVITTLKRSCMYWMILFPFLLIDEPNDSISISLCGLSFCLFVDSVFLPDNYIYSPLYIACKENKLNVMKSLLDRIPVVQCQWHDGTTPLHVACEFNHGKAVELLLTYNLPLNNQDKDGKTPLHICATYGNSILSELLLTNIKENEDLNKIDSQGLTSLHTAVLRGHVETVETLLNYAVDVNKTSNNGNTVLHIAIRMGRIGIIKLLLNKSPDLYVMNRDGYSPFHEACDLGNANVVSLLIAHDSTLIRRADHFGNMPLTIAKNRGHQELVDLFLTQQSLNNGIVEDHKLTVVSPACLTRQDESKLFESESIAEYMPVGIFSSADQLTIKYCIKHIVEDCDALEESKTQRKNKPLTLYLKTIFSNLIKFAQLCYARTISLSQQMSE
ncbi:unnamed protein product [Mytilus coruscus]|uniref:Novel STAND NTPase 3 domain-containing protein n=1 Tax=Mytilus coruscus TaxID=42192 RepID=A0A6J8C9C5_MYTCO|nr:unnamed protein product [Mytilus coruscus]